MLRAATFSRESKGKGSSIDDQERENLEAAEQLGAAVPEELRLRDKVGASRFSKRERVGWPKVIELVDGGQIDLLVVWEVARADRKMDTWTPFVTALAASGVRLHITSLETTYDARKAGHRKALLDMGTSAEHETGVLSERAHRGIEGAAMAGKPHGPAPDGYTRSYGPIVEGKRTFTDVPNERAAIPTEIIKRIANREPINAIEQDLAKRGVRTLQGNLYSRKMIKQIAQNVAYIGMRRLGDTLVQGNWPPICPDPDFERTFWKATKILNEPGRKGSPPGAVKHLLSYLVAAKGCPVQGGLRKQTSGSKAPRYLCVKDGCVSIDAKALETVVLDLMFGRLSKKENRDVYASSSDKAAAALAEAERLETRLEEVRTAYDNEEISDVAFGRKERRLLTEHDAARTAYRQALGASEMLTLLGDEKFELDVVRARFAKMPLPAKRKVITTVFERIEIGKPTQTLTRWSSEEDRLNLAADRLTYSWRTN